MREYFNQFKTLSATKKYDEITSLSLAIACDLVYQDKDMVELTTPQWGYDQVEFVELEKGIAIDTQCYVMSNDQNIVIVFRGSSDIKDWFSNFQAVKDPGPLKNSKAHEGFQDALFPVVIKLTQIINRFNSKGKKLWVTGHSLGGALCSLYAGMLIENGYSVYGLYTFASPRAGDQSFAEQLDSQIEGPHYRVVNTGDIVPHVPPEPFFSHSGKRIILQEKHRETSADSWFTQRVEVLKVFISNSSDFLDVAGNHRLSADDESYIPRLLKDLSE